MSAALSQLPLPACRYDSLPTTHQTYDDWNRTLLDPIFKLDESYVPPDLAPLAELGLPGDYQVRRLLLGDLRTLLTDAETSGLAFAVQSAYRSYSYQARTFDYWVTQQGAEQALLTSARAGHSEHQLGTALDFRSANGPPAWDLSDWAETPEGAWLRDNAWRYGFVMSYPAGLSDITCYDYEPWHYRYIGRDAAAELYESGLTLREWLWRRR